MGGGLLIQSNILLKTDFFDSLTDAPNDVSVSFRLSVHILFFLVIEVKSNLLIAKTRSLHYNRSEKIVMILSDLITTNGVRYNEF